mmetsp:Transcript_1671/g.3572  ORF Transcript_1671/g.3572 Transcript_1671/m.3572 type:complete len:185 (-) Transcript_1671:2377-2931(-)
MCEVQSRSTFYTSSLTCRNMRFNISMSIPIFITGSIKSKQWMLCIYSYPPFIASQLAYPIAFLMYPDYNNIFSHLLQWLPSKEKMLAAPLPDTIDLGPAAVSAAAGTMSSPWAVDAALHNNAVDVAPSHTVEWDIHVEVARSSAAGYLHNQVAAAAAAARTKSLARLQHDVAVHHHTDGLALAQ